MRRIQGECAAVLVALVLCADVRPLSAHAPLAQIIGVDVWYLDPPPACMLPGVVTNLVREMKQPAVIEPAAEPCTSSTAVSPSERLAQFNSRRSLAGLTLRDALDLLVGLDRRYRWTDAGGVLVVRPIAAAADSDHFLHRMVSSFTVSDNNIHDASVAVRNAAGGPVGIARMDRPGRTPEGDRRFTVTLNATSVIDAMIAVARTHGSAYWTVSYCRPEAKLENATITLDTFDGDGGGWHLPVLQDANGTRYSPCADPLR